MGWEVWVFPVNNTDRDKDHTGHTSRSQDTDNAHSSLACQADSRRPGGRGSPACKRGPKEGKITDMREQNNLKKEENNRKPAGHIQKTHLLLAQH